MHDQADELRQLVRQAAYRRVTQGPGAPLVVVGGGKGGVGTTTLAVNLTVALARQGRRAVFVDADLEHGGNASFGHGYVHGSVIDVLSGRRNVHEVLDRGPSGIQVIAGAWASGQLRECSDAAHARFVTQLKELAPHADVVVIDAGSSRNHFARRFWQAANAVLVVTLTDSLAIMDSYAAIKAMLGVDSKVPAHLLVNQTTDAALAVDVQSRIVEACSRFLAVRAHAAGHVPPCQPSGTDDGVLIYPPRGESARALDRVADTLWAQLQLGISTETITRRAARSA